MKLDTRKSNYLVAIPLGFLILSSPLFAQSETEIVVPEITVTAKRPEPSILEYGEPSSVISKEDLERSSQTTLGETVASAPGVRSSFFGQGASRPVVRGFAGDRVRILRNGVTTGDVSDLSDDHVVAADPLQADRVEILRGPETLLYGGSAIGGAVNVIDDSIPSTALGTPYSAEVLGQLGDSADNEKTAAAKLRGEVDRFNWHLSGFSRETDDYEIPGSSESQALQQSEGVEQDESSTAGKVEGSDTKTWGATAGGSYVWSGGYAGLSVSGFDTEYGVPGHVHEHEDEEEHEGLHSPLEDEDESVRIDADQVRVDARGEIYEPSESIEAFKFRTSYSNYEHTEIEGGIPGTLFERDIVEGRLEALHAPIGDFSGAAGVQFIYDEFSAVGDEAFLTPTDTFAPGVFLFESMGLSNELEMRFGGRVEHVNLDPDSQTSESFTPFSLSTGPLWNIGGDGEYSLGINFAYTERAPNALELFANGAHLSRQIFEQGNSGLNKEQSLGVDLALKKNAGLFTGALTPFYQDFSNYINLSGTGTEEDGLPVFRYEEIDAYFWGFEFESQFHIHELLELGKHRLSLGYQLDFLRARNKDDSEALPRIPPLRNILRANYNYADRLFGFVEGVFVEEQDDISQFELPTDAYQMLNAEISVKLFPTQQQNLRLFVRGSNLTNDEARVHSSFLKDLAPLRGRAFLFGIRANI